MSEKQYLEMKEKTAQIGKLLSEGEFAKKALLEAVNTLKQRED